MSVLIHYADAETGVFVGMSWSGKASSMPHIGLEDKSHGLQAQLKILQSKLLKL